MNNRRSFLQQASLLLTAAALSPVFLSRAASIENPFRKIGIQLFTLRDLLTKDVAGTIAHIAKIGYNQVETYYGYPGPYATKGFWGLDAKAFKSLLNSHNLTTPSGHYNCLAFLTDGNKDVLKEQIETAAITGQEYYVIPGLPTSIRQAGTREDYQKMAGYFNEAAELAKTHQLKLAYHNHNFEFKDLGNGLTGYQVLLNETDPALVNFELDLFWAINAGLDPLDLFKQYPGRFKMWHVKDMDKTDKNVYTEVGSGSINFKAIFEKARLSGLEHLFIEQDVIKIDPYRSIEQSLGYVRDSLIR